MAEYQARVVVLFGASGCGKTRAGKAVAEALEWAFIDADDLHPAANVGKMRHGVPLTDADRWPWLDNLRKHVQANQAAGRSSVLACSALRQVYRERLTVDASTTRFLYLRVHRTELARRLRERQGHFFNPSLLDSQLETLEPPGEEETVDAGAPPDLLVEAILARLGLR